MYELTLYRGDDNLPAISANLMSISSDALFFNNKLSTNVLFNDGRKGIDLFDITFDKKVKTAEKEDYLFAILSGSVAAAFDQFAIGKTDLSKLKELDKKELFTVAKNVLTYCGFIKNSIDDLQLQYEQLLDETGDKIKNSPNYKELVKDFKDSLSVRGLLFALFASVTGISIGQDENGNLAVSRNNDESLNGKNLFQKIELGFIGWVMDQVEEYRKTGKFEDEINDLVKGKESLRRIKDMIKSLADLKIFKNKSIDKTEIYKIISAKIEDDTKDVKLEADRYLLTKQLTRQTVPVLLNKCLIRTYLFIKLFISELKERDVRSLAGLELISISVSSKANQRVLARLDTVSNGVFLAIDGVDALYYASKEAIKAANAAVKENGNDAIKNNAAVIEGIKAGVFAYASSINVVNAFEFVAVVKADSEYLIDDVKYIFDKEIIAKQKALEKAREQDQKLLIETTKLSKIETKILYSLELDLIENDIKNTKDSETQVKKNEWKKAWMELSEKATDINKLFYENQKKVYAQFLTKASNQGDNSWIFRIVLELMRFVPYTPIDKDDPKKYIKLKLSKTSYLESVFVNNQNIVSLKEINDMGKIFNKYYNRIGGSTENTVKGVVATVALTATTAAAAFVFAPAIAVALAGWSFTGLSGAALTSASLAFFGGGAIAAGGLGMAGGTLVIAGGGALLGLGASGASFASLLFLSSSALVQEDYAKLLTNCDYILIKKNSMRNEVLTI